MIDQTDAKKSGEDDKRYGARQPVKTIDQVKSVGKSRNREKGKRKKQEEGEGCFVSKIISQRVNMDTVPINKERCKKEDDKFNPRRNIKQVVDQPYDKHHGYACVYESVRNDMLPIENRLHEHNGEEDGDPCPSWGLDFMHTALIGGIYESKLVGIGQKKIVDKNRNDEYQGKKCDVHNRNNNQKILKVLLMEAIIFYFL